MLLLILRHRSWSYVKGEFTTSERDRRLSWHTTPAKPLAEPTIHPGSDIVIVSDHRDEPSRCVGSHAPFRIGVFDVKYGHPTQVGFHYNDWYLGYPTRNSFTLGPLEVGRPLELHINGKFDFSLSSGRERTYIEQHFRLELHEGWNPGVAIPHPESTNILLVDLRKPMW